MSHWTLTKVNGGPTTCFAAVAVGDMVFCFGDDDGVDNMDHRINVHVFNTVSSCWMKLPAVTTEGEPHLAVPSKSWGHKAVLIQNIIYVVGVVNCHGDFSVVLHAFDVNTHRWFKPNVSGTIPEVTEGYSVCALGKDMYVHGGFNKLDECTNDIYKLDTASMVWSSINTRGTPAPASAWHSATMIGAKMFVFGGWGGQMTYNTISMFDTETNCWLSLPSAQLLPEKSGFHSAFVYDGELCIFAGSKSDLLIFNPVTLSWKKVEPEGKGPRWMTSPFTCCAVRDRVVLIGHKAPISVYSLGLKSQSDVESCQWRTCNVM